MRPNSTNHVTAGGITSAEFVLSARRSHPLLDTNDQTRSETASGQHASQKQNLITSAECSGGVAA